MLLEHSQTNTYLLAHNDKLLWQLSGRINDVFSLVK